MPVDSKPTPALMRRINPRCRTHAGALTTTHRAMTRLALLCLAVCLPGPLSAQFTGDPLLPRGALEFAPKGEFVDVGRLAGPDSETALGAMLLGVPVTASAFPELAGEENRLRTLVGDPAANLRAGRFSGRFEANDQRLPLRASWGVRDRVTVGVTVPMTRRRIDATIAVGLEDANVGRNPSARSDVVQFRSELGSAVTALTSAVESLCSSAGADDPGCIEGQAALDEVEGFAGQLGDAWDNGLLFPLEGSDVGGALRVRWSAARSTLLTWDVEAPEVLPLAGQGIRSEDVRTRLVDPVWGLDGFPSGSSEAFLEMGDVEAHVVLGLLDGSGGESWGGFRIRSSLELTVRAGTGTPDSTALIAPLAEPRGHDGAGVRLVTDLLRGERIGIRTQIRWRTFRSADGRLLGVDPSAPWSPAAARVDVVGGPGSELRLNITPRFIIAPGLSMGAGYEGVFMGAGSWTPRDPPTASPLPTSIERPALTQHQGALEFRYSGYDLDVTPNLRFPMEVMGRASWTFAGSGGAALERRVEAGLRLRRDR